MPRIAFLVNNAALGDTRVVKTAEALQALGNTCTVFGCSPTLDQATRTEHNGVEYRVLPLRPVNLRTTLLGHFEQLADWLRPMPAAQMQPVPPPAGPQQSLDALTVLRASDYVPPTAVKQAAEPPPNFDHLPAAKRLFIRIVGAARHYARVARNLLKAAVLKAIPDLQPRRSAFGANLLFGRYLATLYPALAAEPFDVVYAHELWTLPTAARLKHKHPTMLLAYDSHELELHRNNDWSDEANRARTAYEDRHIRSADVVATVCRSIADFLRETYTIDQPLVIHNAPSAGTEVTVAPDVRVKASLPVAPEQPVLVYTGRVTIGRGLPQVIQALPNLPGLNLAIVGPRVTHITEELVAQARAVGVEDRVFLIDPVPAEQLVSVISDADVAVVPIENICLSYYYCLPNKIFEAAFAGVPAIVSDLPELRRFATQHGTGEIVDFADGEAVATALRALLADPQRYNSSDKAQRLKTDLSFEVAMGDMHLSLQQLRQRPEQQAAAA